MADNLVITPEAGLLIIGGLAVGAVGVAAILLSQQPPPGAVATAITLAASTTSPNVGDPVSLSGVLTRTDTALGLGSELVHIEVSTDLNTWSEVTTAITASDGSYSASTAFQNPGTFYLRARFAGA